ncbi:immune inhibitor A [Salsipaludibacter albus]|uniref:immune inhibitor A n=1 Tax=Salsipaludibacter albus TaxID=2849650 RepID=UPI001EE3A5A5|nr:immune inhibitor A [Salsipaludibacter albus]MBY5164181.1 immune inhibitor A [Salsipaludibacter albus]
MHVRSLRTAVTGLLTVALAVLAAPMASADHLESHDWTIGDDEITIQLNDSAAGGNFLLDFDKAYETTTSTGREVYVYAPVGWEDSADSDVYGLTQGWDPNPDDDFDVCTDGDEHVITTEQIQTLGDSVESILEVDEAHFGPIEGDEPFVVLAYNVPDEAFYDCAYPSYTAGYFAPDLLDSYGINVVTIDSYAWSQRLTDYQGTIAHEAEHLLHNYSDPGELSWVDEGLADFAQFLTGYGADVGHTYYHQVFHRETSLTKWGGGLEDYGASYTFFQYLWEQAGGNGDGTYDADLDYDGAGGDLLIKLLFEEQANGMEGVQNAIDTFNAMTGADLRDADEIFADWAVAIDLDVEGTDRFDFRALDLQTDLGGLTIDYGNEVYYDGRGQYQGNMNPQKWDRKGNVPDQTALPFGLSYETFRNPGPNFSIDFEGSPSSQIEPFEGDTHYWGGYASQSDNVLDVDYTDQSTLSFATWYFIEEGWDYGFVEAEVDGEWQTVPVSVDGEVITTDDDPHGNNTEGNGITGTSGGEYFVDEPVYVQATAEIPADATDVRFRYSTDAAYLDTGWFVDAVQLDGEAASLDLGDWVETTGEQDNNWLVQVTATCDITPGVDSAEEIVDGDVHVYRYEGDSIHVDGFDTQCLGGQDTITAIVSNLPTGDLTVFDADYDFTLVGTGKALAKGHDKG